MAKISRGSFFDDIPFGHGITPAVREWMLAAMHEIRLQREWIQDHDAWHVEIFAPNHDFLKLECLYYNGSWNKAIATAELTLAHVIIIQVPDTDHMVVTNGGVRVEMLAHGLTVGSLHYLSPNTAGGLTTTKPVTSSQWVQPILTPLNKNELLIHPIALPCYEVT